MSDASAFGFGKFIPGFDFLQGLAQSAGAAAARPLGPVPQWVAPTVSIEEVDKRITELKAVQFWLEQNGRALAATIQALEVQRMTLSTLKGMNVSMNELAKSFQFPGAGLAGAGLTGAGQAQAAAAAKPGNFSNWPMPGTAPSGSTPPSAARQEAAAKPEEADAGGAQAQSEEPAQAMLGQAMQWWGALTQQFQQIAAKALAEPLPPETLAAAQRASDVANGIAKVTMDTVMAQAEAFTAGAPGKAGSPVAESPAKGAAAKRPAAKRSAPAKPAPAKKAAAKKTSAPARSPRSAPKR